MQRRYSTVANLTLSAVLLAADAADMTADTPAGNTTKSTEESLQLKTATAMLQQAVDEQDSWAYDEPPGIAMKTTLETFTSHHLTSFTPLLLLHTTLATIKLKCHLCVRVARVACVACMGDSQNGIFLCASA